MEKEKALLRRKIAQYRALPDHYETDVTALVNLLLDVCDIRGAYGYIIKDESVMIAVRKTVGIEAAHKKSDKLVFQDTDKPVRGQYRVVDEKPLLVIECKSHATASATFKPDDKEQLMMYMTSSKFPHGLLISEFRAACYKATYGIDTLHVTPNGTIDDTLTELDSLITFIKEACA